MTGSENGAISIGPSLDSSPTLAALHSPSVDNNNNIIITNPVEQVRPTLPFQSSWTGWMPLQSVVYLDTNLFMFYAVWTLALIFLIIYFVSINLHFLALINSLKRLYRPASMPGDVIDWPSVSIVKPLLGVDSQLVSNLETYFKMDYAGRFELLFCLEDPQDSALGVVHSLMEKYPLVEVRIFDKGAMGSAVVTSSSGKNKPGDAPVIINPMVRNMVQGYDNARYDFVWISSARCRGSGDMLRDMVARASDPSVGLVHQMPYIWVPQGGNDYASDPLVSPSRSCPSGSQSFGTTMERLCFSSSLARPYLALPMLNVLCFTGMSYVFRKQVMEEVGGLRAFGHYLAEDFQLSAAISKQGYRPVVAAFPAMQNNGPNLSLNTLKDRLVRWHRLRMSLMPFITFCLEPFQECLFVGAAAAWALHFIFSIDPVYFFPGHIVFWFCCDALLFCSGHRNLTSRRPCCCCCGPARMNPVFYVIAWMGLQFLPLYIIFESFCNLRYITWGKHTYKISRGAVARIVH